jgi:hypothetical protein
VEVGFSGIIVRYHGRREVGGGVPIESVSEQALDQLHVNLWEVNGSSVLDIGLMIHSWQIISAVQVDLPWKVSAQDVSDLGGRLNSEKTIAAIFNEVVQYNGSADQNYAEVSFRPGDHVGLDPSRSRNHGHFALLRLSTKAYTVSPVHSADGRVSSQLRVSLPAQIPSLKAERVYIRFRVRNVPSSVYCSIFPQRDRHLLSSSTETRIIDFRINVRRGVPEEILTSDDEVWFPKFKKIHFFLTTERSQICEFESQNFVGCRSLFDEDIWNEYLKSRPTAAVQDSVRNYLGYQWTAVTNSEKAVKDLVVLGRFSRHQSNWAYIARFILLGLLFGMIGNALWDVLKPGEERYFSNLAKQWRSLLFIACTMLFAFGCMWIPLDRFRKR